MISKTIGFRGLAYFQTHPCKRLPGRVFKIHLKPKATRCVFLIFACPCRGWFRPRNRRVVRGDTPRYFTVVSDFSVGNWTRIGHLSESKPYIICIYIYLYTIYTIYIHISYNHKQIQGSNESVFLYTSSQHRHSRPPELSLAGAGHAPRSFKGGLVKGGRDWIDSLLVFAGNSLV